MHFTRPLCASLVCCMVLSSCNREEPRADNPQPARTEATSSAADASATPEVPVVEDDGTKPRQHPRPQVITVAVADARQEPARPLIAGIQPLAQERWQAVLGPEADKTTAAWLVTLDEETLDAAFAGQSQHLQLPVGAEATINGAVTHRRERGPASATLQGRVQGGEADHFSLVRHRGVLLGEIARYSEKQWFEITTHPEHGTVLRQLDDAAYTARCGTHDHRPEVDGSAIVEEQPDHHDHSHDHHDHHDQHDHHDHHDHGSAAAAEPVAENADHTIDVVVGYSFQARLNAGSTAAMEADIILAVDRMNMAYVNSGIDDAVETVLLATIEDPGYIANDNGSMLDELDALNTTGDGELDAISDLRAAEGADLQTFITADVDGAAGLAYRPGKSAIVAATYMTPNRLTFAHELGHNIGCLHSWGDSSQDAEKDVYNYGWRVEVNGNKYRTIMAYDWDWPRVPYFSNPDVTFNGARMGAADGANVSGDPHADQRYVSGGYTSSFPTDHALYADWGAGFDGSNPQLGARNADYIALFASGIEGLLIRNDLLETDVTALSIDEGGSGSFRVRLQRDPEVERTVIISRTAGGTDIQRASSDGSLTFDSSNWSTWQTVEITAARDSDTTNDVATFTVAPAVGGHDTIDVVVTEFDAGNTALRTMILGAYDESDQPLPDLPAPELHPADDTATATGDDWTFDGLDASIDYHMQFPPDQTN